MAGQTAIFAALFSTPRVAFLAIQAPTTAFAVSLSNCQLNITNNFGTAQVMTSIGAGAIQPQHILQ
jgi:hypothetical protein